jgi:hypothetical protein
MKKILIYLIIGIIVALGFLAMASEENVNSNDHQITIATNDDSLSVLELFTIQGDSNESLDEITVWVQDDVSDIDIIVNQLAPESITQNGSEYICNISNLGIKEEDFTKIQIIYSLNKNVDFRKKILRETNSLSVIYDQKEIFAGIDLAIGVTIKLQLYEPAEPTLDWYITVFIILLVILIVVLGMYAFRKQKSIKIKETAGGSEELLTTKKTLLMELLKDIEKQHRANQISDDTYHKLKQKYKQEAVEVMKQLEDMKSKV